MCVCVCERCTQAPIQSSLLQGSGTGSPCSRPHWRFHQRPLAAILTSSGGRGAEQRSSDWPQTPQRAGGGSHRPARPGPSPQRAGAWPRPGRGSEGSFVGLGGCVPCPGVPQVTGLCRDTEGPPRGQERGLPRSGWLQGGRRKRKAKPSGDNEGRAGRTARAEGAGQQRRKPALHSQTAGSPELGTTWAQETFLFLALIGDPTQSGWKRAQIKRLECWVETRAG